MTYRLEDALRGHKRNLDTILGLNTQFTRSNKIAEISTPPAGIISDVFFKEDPKTVKPGHFFIRSTDSTTALLGTWPRFFSIETSLVLVFGQHSELFQTLESIYAAELDGCTFESPAGHTYEWKARDFTDISSVGLTDLHCVKGTVSVFQIPVFGTDVTKKILSSIFVELWLGTDIETGDMVEQYEIVSE